jgi:[CysO sulfur-carrier protein]-S-L-cysteine hydrolase
VTTTSITLPRPLLKRITAAAEAAYPEECCGLIIGHDAPDGQIEVTEIAESANLSQADKHNSFEVDPKVRFDVMQRLEGGGERIIGHYHSHPEQAAKPSKKDMEMAFEPELFWLISAIKKGAAKQTKAFVLENAEEHKDRRFCEVSLNIIE